ncbi:internal virion protein with endolysin domain [Pectobacterium phage PP74]|uniref:Peptidoglycan transglycosylase gp16 n=1 Tax=Pectobacterium phage PP74 TaxID=1916101 RepID=A0A1J0MEY2_9CAUD|nr:internal virion protein with endolysin domain [Pectobacterium phage PP74]APD19654.1 internal virion protein D [Pectobacterium phage PP74]
MDKYNPNEPHEYDALFQQAADTHGVSYGLLRKVGWVESSFKPTAQSPTGPRGVMQFTKATGQAYGLQNDEDFTDPAKSIDAGARYLSDLVKKYDGDELKAALAYNQGEGRNGKPQLDAYDSGNFASIGDEGRNYLRSLLDVAKSPKSGDIESFGGITPKAKGISFDAAMSGIGKKGKVTTELPESHEMSFQGKEQAAPNQPFGKDYWEAKGTTLDEANERSTFFGFGNAAEAELSNSTLGVAFRAGKRDNGFDVLTDVLQPTRFNSHIWSPEELNKIRTEVKNPAYMNVVLGGSAENLDELIKMANENYEADAKRAEAGLGAKLSAGLIGAGVDPLMYVPIAGTAAKGFKLVNKALMVGAQAGALNVVSEGLRTSVAGGEAHYAEAALAGMLLAGGLTAIAGGVTAGLRKSGAEQIENPFAGAQMRFEARETARNTGGYDASRMPPSEDRVFSQHNGVEYAPLETEPGAVVLKDGSIISDTNLANPMTAKEFAEVDPERAAWGLPMRGLSEIGLRTLRSEHAEIRGLAKDLVRSPTGMESGSHGKFGATASDIKERLHSNNRRTYNDLYGAMKEAMADPEWSVGMFKSGAQGARQEIYRRAAIAIERPELQANLTKAERKVMDIMKEHFDLKREMMENPSMFGNKASSIFPNSRHKGTYVPHVYSREAKQLYSQALGGSDGLQEAIAASWMTSYRSRPEVKARVDEFLRENNAGVFEKANADAKLAADAENFLRGEEAPTMPNNLVTGGQQAGLQKVTGGNIDGGYFAGRRDYSGEAPYMVDGDFVYYTAKTTDRAEFAVDVFTKDGKHAGSVEFAKREGDVWHNPSLEVNEKYRRKGIATKMYNIAETQSPDYVYRGKDKSVGGVRTPDGQAFRKKYDSKKANKVEPQKFNTGGKVEPKVNEEEILKGLVAKYAQDKAYGIAKTDEFSKSSVIDDNIEGLVGIENNSFLEARNLFDSDMPVTLPNGQQFSVNDLRDFDMKHVMPAYDRRVDGDIAIMGGTGKTTAELKDSILALDKKSEGKGTMKGEVEALKDTVKILTGRARRNQDTVGDTMFRALSDMSFFTKNAYMGLQNLTEISGLLAKGNTRAMLHGIPALRDLAFRNKPVSGKELKELHSMVFGKEFDQLIRPTRQDIIQRLRESTDTPDMAAKAVGTIKHTTQELAARSPFTKFLNGTSNYILDMARQGVMGDVVTHAITGKGANKWIKGDMLKSASISKEQWEGIQSLIRENVTRGEDGKFTFKDKRKLANDPRAMDLWRLADKVADETMLRPHKVSLQDSHAFGAGAKLVLQFKTFVIKSMNSKFIRSGNEAFKNHRAMDMALTYAISGGIAGSYYVAQAHLKAAGLPKEQQKDYLKKALDPKMIAYAAASRSSHLGSPLSIANFAMGAAGYDQGLMVRSTILPKGDDKRERNKAVTSRDMGDSIMGAIGEQVPALGFAGAALATGRNAYGVLMAPNKPTEREMMTGLMNAHRELIPNDPISQQMLIKFYEANGVHIKADKK